MGFTVGGMLRGPGRLDTCSPKLSKGSPLRVKICRIFGLLETGSPKFRRVCCRRMFGKGSHCRANPRQNLGRFRTSGRGLAKQLKRGGTTHARSQRSQQRQLSVQVRLVVCCSCLLYMLQRNVLDRLLVSRLCEEGGQQCKSVRAMGSGRSTESGVRSASQCHRRRRRRFGCYARCGPMACNAIWATRRSPM